MKPGHTSGASHWLRSSDSNGPVECMLIRMGVYGKVDETGTITEELRDENDWWRCIDTTKESRHVCALRNLPPGFIETLRPSDSASAYLKISSARVEKGERSDSQSAIHVNPGATVTVDRETRRNLYTQERRLNGVAPTQTTGIHTLLIVRVTGTGPNDVQFKSALQMSQDFFGPKSADEHNLVSGLILIRGVLRSCFC